MSTAIIVPSGATKYSSLPSARHLGICPPFVEIWNSPPSAETAAHTRRTGRSGRWTGSEGRSIVRSGEVDTLLDWLSPALSPHIGRGRSRHDHGLARRGRARTTGILRRNAQHVCARSDGAADGAARHRQVPSEASGDSEHVARRRGSTRRQFPFDGDGSSNSIGDEVLGEATALRCRPKGTVMVTVLEFPLEPAALVARRERVYVPAGTPSKRPPSPTPSGMVPVKLPVTSRLIPVVAPPANVFRPTRGRPRFRSHARAGWPAPTARPARSRAAGSRSTDRFSEHRGSPARERRTSPRAPSTCSAAGRSLSGCWPAPGRKRLRLRGRTRPKAFRLPLVSTRTSPDCRQSMRRRGSSAGLAAREVAAEDPEGVVVSW